MSDAVGKTSSGQKNRLVAMDIAAIKQERRTRPETTGTGAAQRMTAWGIPPEGGCEEDGFANAVPWKRGALMSGGLVGRRLLGGHLFGKRLKLTAVLQLDAGRYSTALPVVHALLPAARVGQIQQVRKIIVGPCGSNETGRFMRAHCPHLNTVFISRQAEDSPRVTTLCLIRVAFRHE